MARMSRYDKQFLFNDRHKSVEDAKADLDKNPRDARAHAIYALALARSHKMDEAKKELDAALAIDPKQMDAHYIYAKVAMGSKDADGAHRHLSQIAAAGGDGYQVRMMLAEVAQAKRPEAPEGKKQDPADMKKDNAQLRFHLEAAHRFDPSQAEPLGALYEMAVAEKREGDLIPLLTKLAALEQHDHKITRALLTKLVEQKAWPEIVRQGEAAIFVDPFGAPTHVAYARGLSNSGRHEKARFELETALLCNPKKPEAATINTLLAQEALAMKNVQDARKFRDAALKLDPTNEEAKALQIP
jgi:tetratricopeptide (TPR) repeat protein